MNTLDSGCRRLRKRFPKGTDHLVRAARLASSVIAFTAVLAGSFLALAQETTGASGGGWSDGQEKVQGDTMVVAAYMALWLILLVFVLRLAARQRSLRKEISELQKQVEVQTTESAR